jgi:hypothetical protein
MSESAATIAAAAAASLATFGGMQTEEDFTAEEARQFERDEAEENGEEVDEIVQELPIVLSQQLAQTLYLMQSPLRYVDTDDIAAAQCNSSKPAMVVRIGLTCRCVCRRRCCVVCVQSASSSVRCGVGFARVAEGEADSEEGRNGIHH